MAKDIRIVNPPIGIRTEVERLAKLSRRSIPAQTLWIIEQYLNAEKSLERIIERDSRKKK